VAAHSDEVCAGAGEWVNYSDAVYDRVGNIEMSRILAPTCDWTRRFDIASVELEMAMEDVRKAGGSRSDSGGCSEHPLGASSSFC